MRNLVSNALKYTRRGKMLLGCRRHRDTLSIEVWDTGIGIAAPAAGGRLIIIVRMVFRKKTASHIGLVTIRSIRWR